MPKKDMKSALSNALFLCRLVPVYKTFGPVQTWCPGLSAWVLMRDYFYETSSEDSYEELQSNYIPNILSKSTWVAM